MKVLVKGSMSFWLTRNTDGIIDVFCLDSGAAVFCLIPQDLRFGKKASQFL